MCIVHIKERKLFQSETKKAKREGHTEWEKELEFGSLFKLLSHFMQDYKPLFYSINFNYC
jgi:hypothetical protein